MRPVGGLSSRGRGAPAVVAISALPRSDTSMMMRILAAGRLLPLTDGLRVPNEDNLHRYSSSSSG